MYKYDSSLFKYNISDENKLKINEAIILVEGLLKENIKSIFTVEYRDYCNSITVIIDQYRKDFRYAYDIDFNDRSIMSIRDSIVDLVFNYKQELIDNVLNENFNKITK